MEDTKVRLSVVQQFQSLKNPKNGQSIVTLLTDSIGLYFQTFLTPNANDLARHIAKSITQEGRLQL